MPTDTEWLDYSDKEIWDSDSDQGIDHGHPLDNERNILDQPEPEAQIFRPPNGINPINEIENEQQIIAANAFARHLDNVQDFGYQTHSDEE